MIAAAAFALGLILATPALAQSARLDPADWSITASTGSDAAAAIDGDAATEWRTYPPRRSWLRPDFPMDLVIDLGQDTLVDGLEYVSSASLAKQGRAFLKSDAKSYEIALQLSSSGEWTTVATGQFPDAPGDAQKVEFDAATGGKVRLRINSSHNGRWTNAAEIGVFGPPEPEPEPEPEVGGLSCGQLGEPCGGANCGPNSGGCDQSGTHYSRNVCNEDNICQSCGDLGDSCCEGEAAVYPSGVFPCFTPGGKYCDDAHICQSCGNSAGEPCCPNENCTFRRGPGAPSLICDNDNTCQDCGGLNQPCCEGAKCNNSGLLCDNSNKCDFCGDTGQPCCEGDFCNNGDNLCHAHEGNQKVCDEG